MKQWVWTVACLALSACGGGGGSDAAADAGADAAVLTPEESALVGRWQRAMSVGTGSSTLVHVNTLRADHTSTLTLEVRTTCGVSLSSTMDRAWHVSGGSIVFAASANCAMNPSSACTETEGFRDLCTGPAGGASMTYVLGAGMNVLTLSGGGTGEDGEYSR